MPMDRRQMIDCSESMIRDTIAECKGDVFVAAQLLGTTPRQLTNAIKASESLQAFHLACEQVKVDPKYDQMSRAQFEAHLAELTSDYRLTGLLAMHDIATMPAMVKQVVKDDDGEDMVIDVPLSAAMLDVKLKAAIQLRGAGASNNANADLQNVLRELNASYQDQSKRIKSVRMAVQLEFQDHDTMVLPALDHASHQTLPE